MLVQDIEKLEAETDMNKPIYKDLVEEMKLKLQKKIEEVESGVYIQPRPDGVLEAANEAL